VRELHVVGTDADGALLLGLAPGGPAQFRLPDARVVPEPRERDIRRAPGPAQIQARLRTGVSPESIARETGTDIDRVMRWAGPVQAEMAGVLRSALASHVSDGDRQSSAVLEDLVSAATDSQDLEVEWQATRRADGRWRVLLRLRAEAGTSTASWVWDGRTQVLEAASARARRLSFGD